MFSLRVFLRSSFVFLPKQNKLNQYFSRTLHQIHEISLSAFVYWCIDTWGFFKKRKDFTTTAHTHTGRYSQMNHRRDFNLQWLCIQMEANCFPCNSKQHMTSSSWQLSLERLSSADEMFQQICTSLSIANLSTRTRDSRSKSLLRNEKSSLETRFVWFLRFSLRWEVKQGVSTRWRQILERCRYKQTLICQFYNFCRRHETVYLPVCFFNRNTMSFHLDEHFAFWNSKWSILCHFTAQKHIPYCPRSTKPIASFDFIVVKFRRKLFAKKCV